MSQIYVPIKLTPEEVALLDSLTASLESAGRADTIRCALLTEAAYHHRCKPLIDRARRSRERHPPRKRTPAPSRPE